MKKLFLVLLALLMVASFGFGQSKGKTEVSFQVWVTPNLTRDFWDNIANAFMAANPDITVKVVEANANTSGAADDFIKMRLAAGDVPDLWWNTTVPTFADSGQLWELPANDPDLKKVKDLMNAAYKGKLYALPTSIQPQGIIFYNKSLWKKAGLAATPKTWAEFDAACAKLKAAGITPMITGGDWVAGYVYTVLFSPEIYANNTKWYTDRWAGKVKFTDANMIEAANRFRDMVAKGWFNKGALSINYSQLQQHFLDGEGAMYPMGSWFTAAEAEATKDFDVGVFYSPTKSGKVHLLQSIQYGSGGVIYAKSEHPQEAYKLLKFALMDKTYGAKFIQVDGLYSALTPPLTYPMTPLQTDLMNLLPLAKTTSSLYNNRVGDAPPDGIADVYNTVGQTILAGGVKDVKPLLQTLDDFWNKAKK
jgi:ABC-type glycerol-3-phosphate transport system substrate-binding protein